MVQSKMRKEMIDAFLNALQEDKIPWHKSWSALQTMPPRNAVKDTEYRGMNRFWLFHKAEQNGYSDPRWCTFKQAKDNNWHVKKGEKGTHVEFWSLYDRKTKKTINEKEADSLRQQLSPEEYAERVKPVANNYTVFNAEQIEGIPKLSELTAETYELDEDELIRTRAVLLENMNVLFQEGGEKAFYRPSEDCIHLPEIRRFESEYDYMATLLHEAGHATGHESRLRRPMLNVFGTPNYAKEELRAEIASAFTAQTLHLSQSGSHMDNHKAYIQSWIKILKNEPDELFRAIKDAEKISDYLIEKGEFTLERSEEKEIMLHKEKSFSEQVDEVLKGRANRYDDLKVCDTPQILLDAGCEQLPMLYTKAHLRKALLPKDAKKHNHGLDVEQIKRLPEYMQEPAMLIDSSTREDSIIVVLSVLDKEKSPLVVTVRPNGKGTYDLEVQDSNFITSVYGRDNFEQFLNLSLENNMVLYWNKTKSQELFSVLGLQFPKGFNNLDYNNIIHQSNNIVKKNQTELLKIENGWESGKDVPGESDKELEGRISADQEKLVDEVAKMEETLHIPYGERITEWFGDYAMNIAKHGVTEEDLRNRREELYAQQAEPTVTIIWSEHSRFHDGETMSLSEANALIENLDRATVSEDGYYKTEFRIDFVMDGQPDNYIGRQDLGDGDGTLIEHIESYHAYYENNEEWNNYVLRNEGKEALEADKAQREMLLHEFVPYLKLHNNLSKMEQTAAKALEENSGMTATETAYHTAMKDYVSKCRAMVNSGDYNLPPVPQLKDFDTELEAYKEHVKEEIAQEAAAAGMTVEEYAINGYQPYSGVHGEGREDLIHELVQLERDTFVPMEDRNLETLQEMTEEQLNEQIAFLKQYRIPVMSFQEMAKLRTDVKRKLLDNFDYYNSLSASEKDILGVMEWIELYRKQGIPDEEIILSHLDEIHSRCGHDSYDYTKNLVCSACSRDRGEYYKRISLADSMEHERQMQKQVSSLSEELDQIERQRINERSIENGKTR